jgi:hypothetical protein
MQKKISSWITKRSALACGAETLAAGAAGYKTWLGRLQIGRRQYFRGADLLNGLGKHGQAGLVNFNGLNRRPINFNG